MIKILNIVTKKLTHDGITNLILNYNENMNKDHFKFDYVCSEIHPDIKKRIDNNIHGNIFILNYRKSVFKYIKNLAKIIKSQNYDIVHIHGSSAILTIELVAAKLAGCKIRIIHSHNTTTSHKIIDRLLRPFLYRLSTHYFACSIEAGKWLFPKRKFIVIKNGCNINDFLFNDKTRKIMRAKYNISDDIVIGHVGSFNYQKNHNYIISIFKEIYKQNKKYRLVLIGDGVKKNNIKKKVKELHLDNKITFVGQCNNVNEWMQLMDIFILPSKFEGLPLVLVESQASGLNCIVSDCITQEAEITNLLSYLPIDLPPKIWADKIINCKLQNRIEEKYKIEKQIKESGYDIKENAKKLSEIYENIKKNK